MHQKLSLAVAVAALSLPAVAAAVPGSPRPLTIRAPDGASLSLRLRGDERLSWFEDARGYSVAFDRARRAWTYADRGSDGRLVPGPHRVGASDPGALGIAPRLSPDGEALARARADLRARPKARPVPLQGEVRNLVLLVQFKDQTPVYQPPDFEPVFNGPADSVRAYYREVSYGRLDLVSTIVGWIPLPRNAEHYAYNSQNWSGRPEDMVADAIKVLDAQGFDFTQFDRDADGVVDAIDVIHSGNAYENTGNPEFIHSHYSDSISVTTHDGVRVVAYHTEAEVGPSGRSITQIGVIAHETAHFFGLPDLYDYGYDSGALGMWSLMAMGAWAGPGNNGSKPTHLDAWSKATLGFVSPTLLEASAAGNRLAPAEDGPAAVKLASGMPGGQYFLLENRQRRGFDEYLPGEGLLIFHVDETQPSNDDQNHYLVDLEQADGKRDLNRDAQEAGDATDPFPLPSATSFTPATRPSSVGYGARTSRLWVTAIARDDVDVLFDVEVRDLIAQGRACGLPAECATGHCVGGICCDKSCAGDCAVCAKELGAIADGTCTSLEGKACSDGSSCTEGDVCKDRRCQGTPITCPAAGPCEVSLGCDWTSGKCLTQPKRDGTSCEDGSACTRDDLCRAGACEPGAALACEPPGECQAGVCDPALGTCGSAPLADGTACSKGRCKAGVCEDDACGCSTAGAAVLPALGLSLGWLVGLRRRFRPRG